MKINIYDTGIEEDLRTVLVKEREILYGSEEIEIHCPKQIVSMMNDVFLLNQPGEEHCYMAATNTKGVMIGVFFVSKGTACSGIVGIREIFVRALLCGAAGIILCHNHPSTNPMPGREDALLTKKVNEAGELLGIPLLDHVIIGGDRYFSFQEYGMM